jgi:hypothetical protein
MCGDGILKFLPRIFLKREVRGGGDKTTGVVSNGLSRLAGLGACAEVKTKLSAGECASERSGRERKRDNNLVNMSDRLGQWTYTEGSMSNIIPSLARGIDHLNDPRLNKVSTSLHYIFAITN